jgi:glutathione S-transferase
VLKLYDLAGAEPDRRFSPYCWRIKMALAHKGLMVETIPWRFTDKDAIAFSKQGRVPVLVDGERWVNDSWAIGEYLETTYSDRPSLFGNAAGKALSHFHARWADATLQGDMLKLVALDIFKHLDAKDRDYFRKSREERLGKTLEEIVADRDHAVLAFRENLLPLRLVLKAQKFLGGETPLHADYAIFGGFQWCRCISDFKLLLPDDPVYAWRQRMLDLFDGLAGKAKGYPV